MNVKVFVNTNKQFVIDFGELHLYFKKYVLVKKVNLIFSILHKQNVISPSIDTFHVASPVILVYLLLFYAILQTPKFNENVIL